MEEELKLPEPWPMSVIASSRDRVYTAAQVREMLAEERERCARVCESLRDDHCAGTRLSPDKADWCRSDGSDGCDFVGAWNDAAAAIRKG